MHWAWGVESVTNIMWGAVYLLSAWPVVLTPPEELKRHIQRHSLAPLCSPASPTSSLLKPSPSSRPTQEWIAHGAMSRLEKAARCRMYVGRDQGSPSRWSFCQGRVILSGVGVENKRRKCKRTVRGIRGGGIVRGAWKRSKHSKLLIPRILDQPLHWHRMHSVLLIPGGNPVFNPQTDIQNHHYWH